MFKKWPSIENTYRQKEISWWVGQFPELKTETYVITEKLHGSNFQWYFEPGQPVKAGSRTQWLDMAGAFQGALLQFLVDTNADIINALQEEAESTRYTIRLFGELIGPKVQKGVDYGPNYQLRYFGMMLQDNLISWQMFGAYYSSIIKNRYVPVVATIGGLQAALDINTSFPSKLLPGEENICERVVIQPCGRVYTAEQGSVFMLKKKNEAFKEKQHVPKERVVDTEVEYLNEEFKSYITDTRLQAVFSKHGEIERPQQIGEYIKLVLADAQEDFLKDFGDGFSVMDKSQQKQVLNVGGMVANMLKAYM